ncbi:MAG: hypothetical protein COV02_01705 [Candidatus Terrybacteria bacterium CG10_big_fil_rev_8_21_14_0_10_41_10]|uniref:Uncharacterized protein n=1 Tax=Candidatus Terrybacteria bacterium CG10_big_fil_rev_8_21_14_0_10_41_10 TaxID=1975026 RepID=A0A2M8LAE7_9BACT|nr:MAG: hypothetical protein COV02_01705 [Candidatus Terrybacteria bacterium CG10_big_fil_rev_8_21_14_0_10_41_10]
MQKFYLLNSSFLKIALVVFTLSLSFLTAPVMPPTAQVYAEEDYYKPFDKISEDTGLIPCEGVDCDVCDIFTLIDNIKDFLVFTIASPLAAIMLAYGGILLITSGGNEKNKTKGAKTITAAIIGIFLVFAAWLIVNTVLGALANKDWKDSWSGFDGC